MMPSNGFQGTIIFWKPGRNVNHLSVTKFGGFAVRFELDWMRCSSAWSSLPYAVKSKTINSFQCFFFFFFFFFFQWKGILQHILQNFFFYKGQTGVPYTRSSIRGYNPWEQSTVSIQTDPLVNSVTERFRGMLDKKMYKQSHENRQNMAQSWNIINKITLTLEPIWFPHHVELSCCFTGDYRWLSDFRRQLTVGL